MAEQLAQAFLGHYYNLFHGDRTQLVGMYQAQSTLTMTGDRQQGAQAIVAKLQSLPKCRAQPITMDCQTLGNGALILINGNLTLENGQTSKFCETFNVQPVPSAPGQFFILNHVFRVQQ